MESLGLGTHKKRKALLEDDEEDELLLTPKKARIIQSTPTKGQKLTPSAKSIRTLRTISTEPTTALPSELLHLIRLHTALEQALSVSLATAQISPDADTGRVLAVVNHISIQERGLGVRVSVEDIKRLCWLWEWNGQTIPKDILKNVTISSASNQPRRTKAEHNDESDTEELIMEDPEVNPFLVDPKPKLGDGDKPSPFLASSKDWSKEPREWIRGGMGFCISSTVHIARLDKTSPTKRVPAYGIGIEVNWAQEDITGGRVGGMKAVARWTAEGAKRKKDIREKLEKWIKLTRPYCGSQAFIQIPLANLPPLPKAPTTTKLQEYISAGTTPRKLAFPSPLATPSSSHKHATTPKQDEEGFLIPFPVLPDERPTTPHGPQPSTPRGPKPGTPSSGSSGIATPSSGRGSGLRTPSFGKAAVKLAAAAAAAAKANASIPVDGGLTPTSERGMDISFPSTPTTIRMSTASLVPPSTVMKTPGSTEKNMPETPTSARRAALYERIRKRSESEGAEKKTAVTASVRSTKTSQSSAPTPEKKVVKMVGPEELRRRVILGRLGNIAEAVWMLFSSTGATSVTTAARKRKALERGEVIRAVVKSSKVPISEAEAIESLTLLCELCPFFLKPKVIGGEEWLEMPAFTGNNSTGNAAASPSPLKMVPTTGTITPPGSPGRRLTGLPFPTSPNCALLSPGRSGYAAVLNAPSPSRRPPGSPTRRQELEEELLNRSPKRIKREEGGLRQVREIIRRELEVDEDDPFL